MIEKIKKLDVGQSVEVICKDRTEYNTLRIDLYKWCISDSNPPFRRIKLTKYKMLTHSYKVERFSDYKYKCQINL